MSLVGSLWIGMGGLGMSSVDLSVIGDNIANANTVGFKASRAAFGEALASLMGRGQVGRGARLQAVQRLFGQGALLQTGQATDLAIEGSGLFVLRGTYNGREGTFLSRAGQFGVDAGGFLVNLEGLRAQGFLADDTGRVTGALGDLRVGGVTSPPSATSAITLRGNLQSDAAVPAAFSPTDPTGTSNFSTTATVYDSLGTPHEVRVYFRRTGAGAWEWHALTDGAGLEGGRAGEATEIATGTLAFDAEGKLSAVTQSSTFNPAGATRPQPLRFDFGDATGGGGTGLGGMTQFAAPSAVSFIDADGYAAGTLASIAIDATGTVTGVFTNGETRALGQLALADVPAPDALERAGGSLYVATSASGSPSIGAAGTGGRGSIAAGALEQSNVDLSAEFVRMITAQRSFQANSKIITTADQLLADLISLKR